MSEPQIDQPFPDLGHEAIRQWVRQALAETEANSAGVDDSYFLSDLLFSLLDSAFAADGQLTTDLAALTERVAALEPPPPAP